LSENEICKSDKTNCLHICNNSRILVNGSISGTSSSLGANPAPRCFGLTLDSLETLNRLCDYEKYRVPRTTKHPFHVETYLNAPWAKATTEVCKPS
jgi:hypothetical protein